MALQRQKERTEMMEKERQRTRGRNLAISIQQEKKLIRNMHKSRVPQLFGRKLPELHYNPIHTAKKKHNVDLNDFASSNSNSNSNSRRSIHSNPKNWNEAHVKRIHNNNRKSISKIKPMQYKSRLPTPYNS
jgi:hypothetical protein